MTNLIVWVEETEQWFYFNEAEVPRAEDLDALFADGYTEYFITVDNDIITSDDYNPENEGLSFSSVYGAFFKHD